MADAFRNNIRYLVAADPQFRIPDAPVIRDDLGAFLYAVDDQVTAENLIRLYRSDAAKNNFDISVVEHSSLDAPQMVLVKRELASINAIAYQTIFQGQHACDKRLLAIDSCINRLRDYHRDLRDLARAENESPNPFAAARNHKHRLPWVKKPDNAQEAVQSLIHVLVRHRLVFLHFVCAERLKRLPNGNEFVNVDRVLRSKIDGYKAFAMEDASDDEYLFRQRRFLDRFANAAINRFGCPDEYSATVEESQLPYWVIDDDGAEYLQESSESLLLAAHWLTTLDEQLRYTGLADIAGKIAYDYGKSRWYSSSRVRWHYLFDLDIAITEVSRAALSQRNSSSHATPGASSTGEGSNTDSEKEVTPASDDVLRIALPLAVMSAIGLRDLARTRFYYPDAIPDAELRSLHEGFAINLKSAVEMCQLERVFEIGKIPAFDDPVSDVEMSGVMGVLALWHPDARSDASKPDVSNDLALAMDKCQAEVMEPVKSMIERLVSAMLFDCRFPKPANDTTYEEPQRFLQMLRTYWTAVRRLIIHHIEAPASYRPHPLMPLVLNLKARIEECINRLEQLNGIDSIRDTVSMLVDIVLSGEPDDLQAAPEWSYDQVASVDRFIEEGRLKLGAKTYPLTPMEEMCLTHAEKSIDQYEERVKSSWAKKLKQLDAHWAANAKRQQANAPAEKPNEAPAQVEQPSTVATPSSPRPFTGGTMAFFEDRVEFCGAEICRGSRNETRRTILNLLKTRNGNKFAAYSGEDLAKAVGLGASSIPGAIRELRQDIVDLLGHNNIVSNKFDVIVNDRTGYHFADCVSVQEAEPANPGPITDTANVPNVRNQEVPNVPNSDNDSDPRFDWILAQLRAGVKLKGTDVTKQFGCVEKTAYRLLGRLQEVGQIEFVGSSRTGYYRLLRSY